MGARASTSSVNTAAAVSRSPTHQSDASNSSSDSEAEPISGGFGAFRFFRSSHPRDLRQRARSLSSVPDTEAEAGASGRSPGRSSGAHNDFLLADGALNLDRVFAAHSLPERFWNINRIKCPVCSELILPDEIECHVVICLTKPSLHYNEDVLTEDQGECVICLEDLQQGDTIVRLPCLCIYHKGCIERWFEVSRTCPKHPES